MANNLIVTYDLIKTKDYPSVHEAIKYLGAWAKVTESNWYVNTNYSAEDAAKKIMAAMDNDDKLMVVDASNNTFYCYNIDTVVLNFMRDQWFN